ncbi:hypothetical protein DMENIID0001_076110 [Sergentomyia squamirostris]
MELKDHDKELYGGIVVKKEFIPPEVMVEFYDKGSKMFFDQDFGNVLLKDEFNIQSTMRAAGNHIIYAKVKQKTVRKEDDDKEEFLAGLKEKTKERKYKCTVCQRGFFSNFILRNHMVVHTREKNFECALCEKRFGLKCSLTRHLNEVHSKEKPWPCGLYDRVLPKDKRDSYQWECSICFKKFRTNYHMKRHTWTVHEGKKQSELVKNVTGTFICPKCKKIFHNKYTFNRHSIVHNDNRPFKCPHCPMNFKKKYTMQRHFLTHEKDKPYICAICSAAFKQKSNLIPHMSIHLGKSKKKCTYCDKFICVSYLKTHIQTVHKELLKNNNE